METSKEVENLDFAIICCDIINIDQDNDVIQEVVNKIINTIETNHTANEISMTSSLDMGNIMNIQPDINDTINVSSSKSIHDSIINDSIINDDTYELNSITKKSTDTITIANAITTATATTITTANIFISKIVPINRNNIRNDKYSITDIDLKFNELMQIKEGDTISFKFTEYVQYIKNNNNIKADVYISNGNTYNYLSIDFILDLPKNVKVICKVHITPGDEWTLEIIKEIPNFNDDNVKQNKLIEFFNSMNAFIFDMNSFIENNVNKAFITRLGIQVPKHIVFMKSSSAKDISFVNFICNKNLKPNYVKYKSRNEYRLQIRTK